MIPNRSSIQTDILETYAIPFGPYIVKAFVLAQYNFKPQVVRCGGDYRNKVRHPNNELARFSPNLNPIEQLWNTLKRLLLPL